jgi:hypothetical protein
MPSLQRHPPQYIKSPTLMVDMDIGYFGHEELPEVWLFTDTWHDAESYLGSSNVNRFRCLNRVWVSEEESDYMQEEVDGEFYHSNRHQEQRIIDTEVRMLVHVVLNSCYLWCWSYCLVDPSVKSLLSEDCADTAVPQCQSAMRPKATALICRARKRTSMARYCQKQLVRGTWHGEC